MRNAITKWFDSQKGYGFLVDSETKEDVFVHYSNLIMDGYKSLHENDMVTYELGAGNDGRQQAINVKPILTPRFIPTCSDALMEKLSLLQKKYKNSQITILNPRALRDQHRQTWSWPKLSLTDVATGLCPLRNSCML